MLTAHQRLAIRTHLPEVEEIDVRDDRGEVVEMRRVRLELRDGSIVTIHNFGGDRRCRRLRYSSDYSDRTDVVPIPEEMRARIVAVFGAMRFDEAE